MGETHGRLRCRLLALSFSLQGEGGPKGRMRGLHLLYPSPAASRHPLPSGEGLISRCLTYRFPFSRIDSTRLPISAVLVVVAGPISEHARRDGNILEGFNNPDGLNTCFTSAITSI